MSYEDPGAPHVIKQVTIRMPYVPDDLRLRVESWPFVTPVSPMRLRRIAEQIGQQFHRETHFDFAPYTAEHPEGQDVVLLPAADICLLGGVLIAGVIGIRSVATAPRLEWAYVHPYKRGEGLVEKAWPDVVARYPGVRLEPDPVNTPAGNGLLDRLLRLTSRSQ